ncbi:MAG: hypothetical protein H0V89_04555 [Deltaproteobacteria bacterium]|nr:hypothetical protein [Deltaproteobacteria bacterium]
MRTIVLAMMIAAPGAALACDGKKEATTARIEPGNDATLAQADGTTGAIDPAHCAKKAQLVGSNCSFSTGMMAQRVLDEGAVYTFAGLLTSSANQLGSHVAAPWTIGPDGAVHVIANEVVEQLDGKGRVSLEGRILEVDGVRYFVATKAQTLTS